MQEEGRGERGEVLRERRETDTKGLERNTIFIMFLCFFFVVDFFIFFAYFFLVLYL